MISRCSDSFSVLQVIAASSCLQPAASHFFALRNLSRFLRPTFSQHDAMMWEHCQHCHRRLGSNWKERRRGGKSACRTLRLHVERLVAAETGGVVRVLVHFHTIINNDLTQSLALCPHSPALTRERCSGAGKHAPALLSRLPSGWRDEVVAMHRHAQNTHSLSLDCCTGACGLIRRNGKTDCVDLVAAKRASRSFSCCLAFLKTSRVRTDG